MNKTFTAQVNSTIKVGKGMGDSQPPSFSRTQLLTFLVLHNILFVGRGDVWQHKQASMLNENPCQRNLAKREHHFYYLQHILMDILRAKKKMLFVRSFVSTKFETLQ